MERRTIVSVIGNAACWYESSKKEDKKKWKLAFDLGKTLVDNGFRVLTGGGKGIMRAAMAGAHASKNYREGDTIAIAPSYDENEVNDYADIVIATGLNEYRDMIVGNSPVVIAIGGGSGTLMEISAAWKHARLLIVYKNVEGWSSTIAGKPLDGNNRYDFKEDKVWGVESADEVVEIIKNWLPKHDRVLSRLKIGQSGFTKKRKSNWVGPKNPKKIKILK